MQSCIIASLPLRDWKKKYVLPPQIAVGVFMCRESYHCFYQCFFSYLDFMNTDVLISTKIEADHIACFHMIIIQITNKLSFTAHMVFIPMPYSHFYYILLTLIINNNIGSTQFPGSGFDIKISGTIYDRSQV